METPAYQYPPPRRISGLVWFLVIAGAVILAIIAFGIALNIAFSGLIATAEMMPSKELDERIVPYGDKSSKDKIAIIPVMSALYGEGSYVMGEGPLYKISKQLRHAAKDSSVKAVVLQIDSPGGTLTASDILYDEVKRIKEAGKPVVVTVNGVSASGAVYASAPADYIIATPTSLVGSIGVIFNRFELSEMMKKLGIKPDPIKSTEMKDVGSPFRSLTPEERRYFEDLLDKFHSRFVSIVAEGRKLKVEEVQKIANGLIFTTEQALEYKLIDQIGYFDQALDKALELTGLETARYIRYEKPFNFQEIMAKLDERSGLSLQDVSLLLSDPTLVDPPPQVMAIWNGRSGRLN